MRGGQQGWAVRQGGAGSRDVRRPSVAAWIGERIAKQQLSRFFVAECVLSDVVLTQSQQCPFGGGDLGAEQVVRAREDGARVAVPNCSIERITEDPRFR